MHNFMLLNEFVLEIQKFLSYLVNPLKTMLFRFAPFILDRSTKGFD